MKKHYEYSYFIVLALMITAAIILPLLSTAQQANTGVKVIVGPTPIMEGEAKGPNDVTLMNEYLAVAFGISTMPPWGIPTGHIIDIAPVSEKCRM